MISVILAAALSATAVRAAAPALDASSGGVLNLNCIEALASIGEPKLAGVFSFIAEKDSPAAFADLVAHDGKALKKYVVKVEQDFKASGGVTEWDHEVLMFVLSLYSGPLGQTLEKPAAKVLPRLNELSLAPKLTLEQVTARRKK